MSKPTLVSHIAARVRARRTEVGLTRRQLAQAADVSERYLSDLEGGAANVSIGILARVAEALGVSVPALMPATGPLAGLQSAHPSLTAVIERVARLPAGEQQSAVAHLDAWLTARRRPIRGVALLGLRGAGKTSIGTRLAARLDVPFISITRDIEARAGMSLADLFNLGGPDAYRALEDEVIGELVQRHDFIILETAGGIVGNVAALDRVLESFTSVWIKALPREHLDRVVQQGDVRPMLGHPRALEHLEQLLALRQADYARAEHVLDTTGRSIEACVNEIEARVQRSRS